MAYQVTPSAGGTIQNSGAFSLGIFRVCARITVRGRRTTTPAIPKLVFQPYTDAQQRVLFDALCEKFGKREVAMAMVKQTVDEKTGMTLA